MIKEYNYYITTNRFSQIAEELETTVRSYAENIGKKGENELREKARSLCSSHLVSSGLRRKENSFINIDAEFFDGGELLEANLNRFIKDVLKAHGYQKVLWEYMGTTGMMTEISKSAMKADGFNYENYLPEGLKEKEIAKGKITLNRNFNRLQDDSGFDWGRGYDPNDTIEKKGWFSDYDENGIWTRFVVSGKNEKSEKENSSEKIYKIKLIKTEKGCMLYDPGMILLNPILLWYLTQDDEIYGAEESDTIKLVDTIKNQIADMGEEKITEVSFGTLNHKTTKEIELLCEKYKSVLGEIAEKKLTAVDSQKAELQAEENISLDKNKVIEENSAKLQKKIAAILKVKQDASAEEITAALENGKTEIPLDVLEEKDAKAADFSDEEFETVMELAAKLPSNKRTEFAKVAAVISKRWNEYKSCGKSKTEGISLLYEYIKDGKENEFNYELTLNQVLKEDVSVEFENSGNEIFYDSKAVEKIIKEKLPQENQSAALAYISSLPEQTESVKTEVYKTLCSAVKNYLTVRMSTGMSIKELFDYAVKSRGGKLPKASFTPPVVGYISSANTSSSQTKDATGEKRIYFEGKVSTLFVELINKPTPHKEVNLEVLEEVYERSLSKKKCETVKIGYMHSSAEKETIIIYDTDDIKTINPAILEILKTLYVSKPETKNKIRELAKVSESREDFIKSLSKQFQIEYNFADEIARELYTLQNKNVSKELLVDYAKDFEAEAEKLVTSDNYVSSKNIQIEPVFKQISEKETELSKNKNRIALPSGYKFMTQKTRPGGILESITSVSSRLYKDSKFTEFKPVIKRAESLEETSLSEDEKKTVELLISEMDETEKIELVYAAGEDWNNITPFLIREFIWRKKNNRSVKNLSEQIKVYEKLGELPQSELEKYLTSSVVNGSAKTISFDSQSLSFIEEENRIFTSETQSMPLVPVTKLTQEEKEKLQNKYGIKTESLSPVIKEYIKSGEWKKEISVTSLVEKSENFTVSNKTVTDKIAESRKIKKVKTGLIGETDSETKTRVSIETELKSETCFVSDETQETEKVTKTEAKENLSSEKKKTVQLLLDGMTEKERVELIASVGSDQNILTPLFIKEYLWRKKNKKGVTNLLSEVSSFEKLSTIPQSELEKFLTSTAVNGNVKKISFDKNNLSFNYSPMTSASEGVSYKNPQDVKSESISRPINLPVIKLTPEEKYHYSQTYGLPTEGLSPVVQAYIKSGEWKKSSRRTAVINTEEMNLEQFALSSFVNNDGYVSPSMSAVPPLTNGSLSRSVKKNGDGAVNNNKNLPHSKLQIHAAANAGNTSAIDTAYPDSVVTTSTAAQNEAYSSSHNAPLTEPLKESLSRLASIKSHKSQNPELSKLDRINANYEHDKAVLAKNDPLFAKNQFWDVGHADGTEEMTNSEMVKAATRTNNDTKINLLGGI